MSRVLDGGDGLMRGGNEERSSDSGVLIPFDAGLEAIDVGGDMFPAAILNSVHTRDLNVLAAATGGDALCRRKIAGVASLKYDVDLCQRKAVAQT